MKIDGVNVLVCAGYDHDAYWLAMTGSAKVSLERMEIPCFSLESERDAYFRLGMTKEAELVGEFLKR